MLTLSLAKCIKATKNGSFRTADLKPAYPLTCDDLVFLSEYFRLTPLTEIELSIDVTAENITGLKELSKTIGQNKELIGLRFQVEQSEFHLGSRDNLMLSILNYFTNRQVTKMNSLIYDAMVNMVKNKPDLKMLNINLEAIDTPANSRQAYRFATTLQSTALEFLDLNFKVEKNAELPILDKIEPNFNLIDIKLKGITMGRDILKSIQRTHSLRLLLIDDMLFEPSDIDILGNIFKCNPSMSLLSITNTNIGQIESPQLLDKLKFCPDAAYIDLSGNNFSQLNIDALCNFLATETDDLKELNISHNTFMASEAKKLADVLARNKKIETLILDGNYIEDEGLQAIIQLLHINKTINTLSMSKNTRYAISDATVDALCALLRDPECQLEELNFVQITSLEQLRKLGDAIMANSSLVAVKLDFHTSSILGVIYQIQIQEHLDGLTPLIGKFVDKMSEDEEQLTLFKPNEHKPGHSLEDVIFPNQQPVETYATEENTQNSLQLS
jgi:Ran GTPase-activating protein (RanGAP) involved in mRNA processing and transport